MASSNDYLEFILEQLSPICGISYRKMMGEYILYLNGKIVGGIYDNRLMIKPTSEAAEYIGTPVYEKPYETAKDMILVENVDDRDYLSQLFLIVFNTLP